MSVNSPILPAHILEKMDPRDRAQLGRAGLTATECAERSAVKSERAEQRLFSSWLSLRGIYFVRPRDDKKSTIRTGHPDYSLFHSGKVLFVEMKVPGGRLSEEQNECMMQLRKAGFTVVTAYGAAEAIAKTRQFFGI
jgi:VRR-NUC domain